MHKNVMGISLSLSVCVCIMSDTLLSFFFFFSFFFLHSGIFGYPHRIIWFLSSFFWILKRLGFYRKGMVNVGRHLYSIDSLFFVWRI
ncbi:hypothetical protein QBC42DRAFT_279006 [Cladorrhinum samala]|uniref:Uncharacterized protein n=1 Tax=Cladorrhinum samala TaxID=585594 RepID=A0AAV9HCH8_9PEZI|nr:hypothetical protein QBC42DRAFT_279006 [Cladorrhinum samala]